MLADQIDAIIGVETHHDTHNASVVAPMTIDRHIRTGPALDQVTY